MSEPRDISRLIDEWTPVQRALERAAAAARREHKLLGLPMPIWQEGRVVWLAPEQIEVEETAERATDRSAAL
jgi:hypothetical protein